MSEKFKRVWRNIKDGLYLLGVFIPIVLVFGLITVITFSVVTVIKSLIVSACWNVAMTTMFGFNDITMLQALVLSFAIGCMRANYYGDAKSMYAEIKEQFFNKAKNEKSAKILSVIFTVLLTLFSILITVWLVMYSWNDILPKLLNIELCHISFVQAFGFFYIFNLLFNKSQSYDKKSKEDKESKNVPETKDDVIEVEAIEVELVSEDNQIE